jgi:enoyl-CoA hydratase
MRPEKANAYNQTMLSFISERIDEFEVDNYIRCFAFVGQGKSFCSGADLTGIKKRQFIDAFRLESRTLFTKIHDSSKFTIAIINGSAVAGGLELITACDFRISSTEASFSLPELTLGIIPAAGGIQRLIQLVGVSRAKELILLKQKWNASESFKHGLVNRVVDRTNLMKLALELIHDVVETHSLAFQLAKESINNFYSHKSAENFDKLSQAFLILLNQIEVKNNRQQ